MAALVFLIFISTIPFGNCVEDHPTNLETDGWIYNHTVPAVPGADPRGSIRCIGARPDELLDLESNRPPNIPLRSPLEYCAEPDYGGRLHQYWNDPSIAGVACGYFMDPPRIVISRKFGDRSYHNDWKRFHYCQTKCFCLGAAGDVSPNTAESVYQSNRALPLQIEPGHPRTIRENIKIYCITTSDSTCVTPSQMIKVNHDQPIPIFFSGNGVSRTPSPDPRFTRKIMVAGAHVNQIYCENRLPPWNLPVQRNYQSLHELCAANFLEGNPDANAGGICFDPATNNIRFHSLFAHPKMSLPNSMTLLYAMAMDRMSIEMVTSVAIVSWCLSHCVCDLPTSSGERAPLSNQMFLGRAEFDHAGRWTVSRTYPGSNDLYVWNLIDAAGNPIDRSVSQIFRAPESSPQTCSRTCTSQSDCTKTGQEGCSCRVERNSIASSQTYDPIVGSVLKHTFTASCFAFGLADPSARYRLGLASIIKRPLKRSGSEPAGQVDEDSLCACNTTYISPGCCESKDGIIWEGIEEAGGWGDLKM